MRQAANRDVNHEQTVLAFRGQGCSVESLHRVGGGVPDLLVGLDCGAFRLNLLVEVKRGDGGAVKGALSEEQAAWHSAWRGQVAVVRRIEDVRDLVKAARALAEQLSAREAVG